MTHRKYAFNRSMATALLKVLGLEGRAIRRIELIFDVNEAVHMRVFEYVSDEGNGPPLGELIHLFESLEWHEVATDDA